MRRRQRAPQPQKEALRAGASMSDMARPAPCARTSACAAAERRGADAPRTLLGERATSPAVAPRPATVCDKPHRSGGFFRDRRPRRRLASFGAAIAWGAIVALSSVRCRDCSGSGGPVAEAADGVDADGVEALTGAHLG